MLITDSALTDSQEPVSRCCDRDMPFPVVSTAIEQRTWPDFSLSLPRVSRTAQFSLHVALVLCLQQRDSR